MEAASSSSASLSVLRHRLLAAVGACFLGGNGQRVRWRRRAGAAEFRYDALSYALNFDRGDLLDADDGEGRRRGRFLCRSLPSQVAAPTVARAAVEAA